MLSVRGLTVEIGGTLVVEGAGFTVRAGDRVGLVGRNGAGKTTLLRTLGGMSEPKAGIIQRPAAFGYLPQDPRLDALRPDVTSLSHVLGGRGLDRLAAKLDELHAKMTAQPGDEKVVAAWIEVRKGWREVKLLTKATVAAANGNGLIVKE